uniref:CASP-like protein n=1 Tax=Aegilops tauschii TaxID=37682 RepID=M8CJL9_AEGTA
MASSRRALPVATLALRVLALLLLAASIIIIATAELQDSIFEPQGIITFKDLYAYQYVLAVGVIGCAYNLVAALFVAINVAGRRKMVGGGEAGTVLLICADVVCAVLVATGGAVGLGLTVEVQRRLRVILDSVSKTFFIRVDISCGALLLASLCIVFIVMLSSFSLTK